MTNAARSYNDGWNQVAVGIAKNAADGTLAEYFRKLNVALGNVDTDYAKGVKACIRQYQEEVLAPAFAA